MSEVQKLSWHCLPWDIKYRLGHGNENDVQEIKPGDILDKEIEIITAWSVVVKEELRITLEFLVFWVGERIIYWDVKYERQNNFGGRKWALNILSVMNLWDIQEKMLRLLKVRVCYMVICTVFSLQVFDGHINGVLIRLSCVSDIFELPSQHFSFLHFLKVPRISSRTSLVNF